MNRALLYIIAVIAASLSISCQDQVEFTSDSNAKLSFSTDTVHFDTVFTTIGSTTQQFRIYNKNSNTIKTDIKLAGGSGSYYRLNIDGMSTDQVNDLEIMGNDSVYVFVEVNVDPQNSNSPLVITDSIEFATNGNIQDIKLVSYGQDVHLFKDSVIGTQTWQNDKPYLIYNSILVDSLETLTIEPGVQIHFHPNSSLLVKGTLLVNGTKDEMVVFQGDRLDADYKELPGQWGATFFDENGNHVVLGGIHLLQGSLNNNINYAEIKNSNIGIQVDYFNEASNKPTLTLSNSIIKSMSLIGIEARTSSISMNNTVIGNCGYYCMRLMYGGSYEFYHSTFANYYPSYFGGRSGEAIAFNNYYVSNDEVTLIPFNAKFGNCIIHGNGAVEDELIIDKYPESTATFDYEFDHCMLKLGDEFDTSDENIYKNIIRHPDSLPRFIDTDIGNFRLDTLSSAIDKGSSVYGNQFPLDQDGNSRTIDIAPDMGAYERIENQ